MAEIKWTLTEHYIEPPGAQGPEDCFWIAPEDRPALLAALLEDVLPTHACGLYLAHNEHLDLYQSAEEWAGNNLDDDDWVSPEEKAKALATGEVWVLKWYPDTPVGFFRRVGSTAESVLGPEAP